MSTASIRFRCMRLAVNVAMTVAGGLGGAAPALAAEDEVSAASAEEAAVVNERDGVLVLSPEAGAWDELADAVVPCDPFDVAGTADALHHVLTLDGEERRALSTRWRERATTRTPADWLADNLAAAD